MHLLFCSDPLDSKSVDMDYREEYEVACSLGFDTELVNWGTDRFRGCRNTQTSKRFITSLKKAVMNRGLW